MRRAARSISAVSCVSFGVLSFALSWLRWSTCHNHTFDLALYARSAWGLAQADAWNPIADASFVHLHAAWILIPLGVIARALQNLSPHATVLTLLAAQAIAIAACVWPLSRIAERHLGAWGAPIAAMLWIAYPNLGHVGSYEMHPGTLALLPLCWALDAFDRGDAKALALATLGVLVCRADYALITAWMGLLLARHPSSEVALRSQRWRITTIAGSLAYFATIATLQRVLPSHGVSSATLHFGPWGGSPLGIVSALFSDPQRVFDHFMNIDRLSYVPRILLPLAGLPLLRPRLLLLAAPTVALNLISVWPTATRLDSHYLTPTVPALIVAAMVGLAHGHVRWPHARYLLVVAPLAASVIAGGLPWSRDFPRDDMTKSLHTVGCLSIVNAIADAASVQAPDHLLPHLAQRTLVHRAPPPDHGTDFVVLDASHRQRFAHQETLLRTREEPLLRTWLARDDYGVMHATDTLILLQRQLAPRNALTQRYIDHTRAQDSRDRHARDQPAATPSEQTLTDCLAVTHATRHTHSVDLHLRAKKPCPADLALRLGATPNPTRVDLLFDGLLSPAHLHAGDALVSTHVFDGTALATMDTQGLWVGTLRSSGARPLPADPLSVRILVKN